jgi:hypothetical protein
MVAVDGLGHVGTSAPEFDIVRPGAEHCQAGAEAAGTENRGRCTHGRDSNTADSMDMLDSLDAVKTIGPADPSSARLWDLRTASRNRISLTFWGATATFATPFGVLCGLEG